MLDRVGVLTAIEFNNHPALKTHEVEDIVAIRVLAAKLTALDLAPLKVSP